MQFLKSFYIHNTFFRYLALLSACFILSFWLKWLYPIAWVLILVLLAAFLLDVFLLYGTSEGVEAKRILPKKLSNSDLNPIRIQFTTNYPFTTRVSLIDELPQQFQKRDFEYNTKGSKGEKQVFDYTVRPVDRGGYVFGNLNVYASSPLRIIKRRFVFQKDENWAIPKNLNRLRNMYPVTIFEP
jgi:uncharacterized protein (DUF58 family)